jgi:CBS domain-containing protein
MASEQRPALVDTHVSANGEQPIGALVTRKGRTLAVEDTVADARRVFGNPSVDVLPIVDERRYVGAVTRETITSAPLDESLGGLASPLLPTATADLPLHAAMASLVGDGGTRLVVLDPHDGAYRGLVCLTPDRTQLCIAAECHSNPSPTPGGAS